MLHHGDGRDGDYAPAQFFTAKGNDPHDGFLPHPHAPDVQLAHVARLDAPARGIQQFNHRHTRRAPFPRTEVHCRDGALKGSQQLGPREGKLGPFQGSACLPHPCLGDGHVLWPGPGFFEFQLGLSDGHIAGAGRHFWLGRS